MKAEEIRFHRLAALYKVYEKNQSDSEVMNRALLMGVTTPTARSYLKAIKMRFSK